MATVKEIAPERGMSPKTVIRRITTFNKEHGTTHKTGLNDEVTDKELLEFISWSKSTNGKVKTKKSLKNASRPKVTHQGIEIAPVLVQEEAQDNKTTTEALKQSKKIKELSALVSKYEEEKSQQDQFIEETTTWREKFAEFLTVLPLPMLGLAASYGVYLFASQFAPVFVAVIEAAAFEIIYISLAAAKKMYKPQRDKAEKVSKAAVAVSVVYNIIAGYIHHDPQFMAGISGFWFFIFAVFHGSPMAVLGYFVADLRFHTKEK